MPIYLIDKIKQKNNGTFKLVDDYDIEWHSDNTNKIPLSSIDGNIATSQDIANAIASAPHMKRTVLNSKNDLPTVANADSLTIYMVPNGQTDSDNLYDEFVAINNKWERVGGISQKVSLDDYYTKEEVNTKVDTATSTANSALSSAKQYTDQEKAKYIPLAGGTMTGKLVLSGDPLKSNEAATKNYVDSMAAGVTPTDMITSSDVTTGTANGTIGVKGTDVPVKGLQDSAYTSVADILSKFELNWHDISEQS